MFHIVEMTDEEKLQMYRGNCTFDELARMHIELLKHIPEPALYDASIEGKPATQDSASKTVHVPSEVVEKMATFVRSQVDIPPEMAEVLTKHLWDLI